MSQRPTQSQTSSKTEAECLPTDARVGGANVRRSGPSVQQPFSRAEPSRDNASYRIERATLYHPEPPDEPPLQSHGTTLPPPRSLLPVALTLLGVVVIAGLAGGMIVIRNTDGGRIDDPTGRLEQFSERGLPQSGATGSRADDTVPYDLTRRPTDTIVGAWRDTKEEARAPQDVLPPASEAVRRPAASKRRALPTRITILSRRAPEEVSTEVAETPPSAAPAPSDPRPNEQPTEVAEPSDKGASNVVARVGRVTKPDEPEVSMPTRVPRPRVVMPEADEEMGRPVHANRLATSRYRIWKKQRARARANRPDPYDAFLTEKAAQGIRFYGVHRQNP